MNEMGGAVEIKSRQRNRNWTIDDWAVYGRLAAQLGLDRDGALKFLEKCTGKKASRIAKWIFKARYNQALGWETPFWRT